MAVRDLNLTVRPGDLYGFLGPNGAGKTTAIRCILGLIRRDGGRVRIFGEEHPVRQRVGVGSLVETPTFHPWLSGRTNLEIAAAYAGGVAAEDLQRALDRVGLRERADEAVRRYSLGMKQRLGIARALVSKPRLLVLDEPTNGLDPRGMREVRELLIELARRDGLTVFISSHLLGEVEAMCNRVAIIDRGELRAEGSPGELLRNVETRLEVEVKVDDPIRAREVILATAGAADLGDGPEGALRVSLGDGATPEGLNRALVTAGVGVRALLPRGRTLEEEFLAMTSADPELVRRS